MKLLVALSLLISLQLEAQIILDPIVQGVYVNEIAYVGTYGSPGNCTWADGTDFIFDFSQLYLPDGLEYVLVIDEPDPSSTTLLNGWLPVSVGDSTVFSSSTTSLGISAASGPATINFHVRIVGTATTPSQEYPCWIDQIQTLANCENTFALLAGESLVPCVVSASVGISDPTDNQIAFNLSPNGISISCNEKGTMSLFDMSGKMVIAKPVNPGFTFLELKSVKNGNYIVRFENINGTKSQKIALQ